MWSIDWRQEIERLAWGLESVVCNTDTVWSRPRTLPLNLISASGGEVIWKKSLPVLRLNQFETLNQLGLVMRSLYASHMEVGSIDPLTSYTPPRKDAP